MKIKNLITNRLILCASLLLFSFSVSAQGNQVSFIKTIDGYLMVYNDSKNLSFTIEFTGQQLEPIEIPESTAVNIDGQFVQLVTVEYAKFIKTSPTSRKKPAEQNILQAHRDWESDYLGGALKTKLDVKSEFVTVRKNQTAMFWSYVMPEKLNAEVTKQLFLTIVLGKKVLNLNMSVERNTNTKDVFDYMLRSMTTLKVSPKPFDVKALSEELK